MNFYLIGADYQSAKIEVRENLAGLRQEIANFWQTRGLPFAILSTCNRFEIYGLADDINGHKSDIDGFCSRFRQFSDYGYARYGRIEVFRHLLRLAVGLESQIKGELQILQQLGSWLNKKAFPLALAEVLHDVMLAAYSIRSKTLLKATEHNIAALLFDAIRESITASEILEIVVIGTGKIAELFAAYRPKRVRLRFAAHKNFLKAKELATLAAGEAISFRELPAALLRADVLISATSSPHFILSQENLLQIAAGRPRPIYIYDLAIPRDIEPQDRWLENIVLKNLDDLSPVFQAHNLKIQEKLEKAQYFIEEAVAHYAREIKAGHTAKPFSFAAS